MNLELVIVALLAILLVLNWLMYQRGDSSAILSKLEALRMSQEQADRAIRDEFARNRSESSTQSEVLRTAVGDSLHQMRGMLSSQVEGLSRSNEHQLGLFRSGMELRLDAIAAETSNRLKDVDVALRTQAQQLRDETGVSFKNLGEQIQTTLQGASQFQRNELQDLRTTVDTRLATIQAENEKKLEQMRQTVDEKLQGSLEARLGESFKQVSDRLEQVYKGLGEMQTLATGVGDLKRVLTNVKTRGTWGEVQLGALLEQILAPDQYAQNVNTTGTGERVEFAIRLPGYDSTVWLPIDAKFPVEDYQRLVDASERGDREATEKAAGELANTIRLFAKGVSEKYLAPPLTTDFGILYLATEGLYAEAVRRPGFAESLQRDHRIVLSGPSTLAAMLNSFQMGFRTLAIQKRSSEVWELLGAVKSEFGKYADVLSSLKKKLGEAQNTIDKAETRTRAIHRKLREVESTEGIALLDDTEPLN